MLDKIYLVVYYTGMMRRRKKGQLLEAFGRTYIPRGDMVVENAHIRAIFNREALRILEGAGKIKSQLLYNETNHRLERVYVIAAPRTELKF